MPTTGSSIKNVVVVVRVWLIAVCPVPLPSRTVIGSAAEKSVELDW
jgi:hypothetical protein